VKLVLLTPEAKLAEIRRLYYETSSRTIQADLDKAILLLKSMASDEERQRAAVYMDGLAEMRRDWTPRKPRKR
jgi:hypothetical protein